MYLVFVHSQNADMSEQRIHGTKSGEAIMYVQPKKSSVFQGSVPPWAPSITDLREQVGLLRKMCRKMVLQPARETPAHEFVLTAQNSTPLKLTLQLHTPTSPVPSPMPVLEGSTATPPHCSPLMEGLPFCSII